MAYTINSRDIDGTIKKSWKCELIEQVGSRLVFIGTFDRGIDHPQLGTIVAGTVSYEFYWLDRWYNVFRFHEPDGSFRNFYCNINMPPVLGPNVLDYVDLDIDLMVDRSGVYRILDEDEYRAKALSRGYSDQIRDMVDRTVVELTELIGRREFPFHEDH